jgi:hypothetical protein
MAMLIGLSVVASGCQSNASEITLQNRTTSDVILMVQGGAIASFFIPACGQVAFDPYAARPTDLDPSVSHADAAVLPYYLGLVADAPTIATVVITDQGIYRGSGRPASLGPCIGVPPDTSPSSIAAPSASPT